MTDPISVEVVLHAMNRARYCALRATMQPRHFRIYWRADALSQTEFVLEWIRQDPPAHREMYQARELLLAGMADPKHALFRDAQDCISRAIDLLREKAEEWAEHVTD